MMTLQEAEHQLAVTGSAVDEILESMQGNEPVYCTASLELVSHQLGLIYEAVELNRREIEYWQSLPAMLHAS